MRPGRPPRIIAEIGTAHGGDFSKAAELIHAAAEAGADVAKFQAVIADEIVHPEAGEITLPGGAARIYNRFKALEQPAEFYARLQQRCVEDGLEFLCTPFGIDSARLLSELRVREYKVASPELNHLPLLRYLGGTGLPLILSTGVSTLADIELALATVSEAGAGAVTLLHCVTAYPAPAEEYNLSLLPHLSGIFGVDIGISDHSEDPELVPGLATLFGATVIEKHITLSKQGKGLDDAIALEPDDFRRMAGTAASVAYLIAAGASRRTVLEEFEQSYGRDKVSAVLGDGRKRLAPAEANNYRRTNRSLIALRALEAGERLTASMVAPLRSEQNVEPGLHPQFLERILGGRLAAAVTGGSGLRWEHLLDTDRYKHRLGTDQ